MRICPVCKTLVNSDERCCAVCGILVLFDDEEADDDFDYDWDATEDA